MELGHTPPTMPRSSAIALLSTPKGFPASAPAAPAHNDVRPANTCLGARQAQVVMTLFMRLQAPAMQHFSKHLSDCRPFFAVCENLYTSNTHCGTMVAKQSACQRA